MAESNQERFQNLTFEKFRELAQDTSLSKYEKIGFPDAYRAGKEAAIFSDITRKLTNLNRRNQLVLDIGPGCSDLPRMFIELCEAQGHRLILVDSAEMLAQLPDRPFITKLAGYYPALPALFEDYAGQLDVILTYSVFHYIFAEGNVFDFLDKSLSLLAAGGQLLIGDIPNQSKRRRFFSSAAGIRYHQEYTGTTEIPQVAFNTLEPGVIDDTVLLSLVTRCHNAGFDAYVLPQADDVPMANRRDDLFIRKP